MKSNILILLLVVLFSSASGQSYNMGMGMVYLYAGGTSAQLHTTAQFDVSSEIEQYYPSVNSTLDLEKDLDFPSSSQLFYIKGIVGTRIQLAASFFSLHRSGGSHLTKTFAFGDHTYTVSAPVTGYFNTDYYSASVRFSFVRTPIVTAGLSLGARYLKLSAGIHADSMGYVFDKSGDMNVPVVVPGIHASVYPINNLLLRGTLEYFTLTFSGTKGSVLEAQLTAEYYILKYLGVGAGYTVTHLKANDLPDNPIYLRDIDYKIGGPQLFAAFRF